MKIEIVAGGPYADFCPSASGTRIAAVHRHAGDVVDYPEEYARDLIRRGEAIEYAPDAQRKAPPEKDALIGREHPVVTLMGREHPGEEKDVDITPEAKTLAKKHGVDLRTLPGSGQGGRILVGDVRRHLKETNG